MGEASMGGCPGIGDSKPLMVWGLMVWGVMVWGVMVWAPNGSAGLGEPLIKAGVPTLAGLATGINWRVWMANDAEVSR